MKEKRCHTIIINNSFCSLIYEVSSRAEDMFHSTHKKGSSSKTSSRKARVSESQNKSKKLRTN